MWTDPLKGRSLLDQRSGGSTSYCCGELLLHGLMILCVCGCLWLCLLIFCLSNCLSFLSIDTVCLNCQLVGQVYDAILACQVL